MLKNIHFYIINGLALFTFLCFYFLGNLVVTKELMFLSPDSQSYMDVANWLKEGIETPSLAIRPILYPLLILITNSLFGVYGIWIMHVIFWLLTINFTFYTIKKITNSYCYSYIAGVLLISNFSLLSLTFHALTEVTTTFLLSALVFFIVKNFKQNRSPFFIQNILFFLVILTLVKPVFSIPLYITVLLIFPTFYLKQDLKSPLKFIKIILIFIPLFIQLTIIKVNYDKLTVSLIGSITITNYIVAQGIEKVEQTTRDESINIANSQSNNEQIKYVKEHIIVYSNLFFENLFYNIKTESTFLLYPKEFKMKKLATFMYQLNNFYFLIHRIFILLTTILFFMLLNMKNYNKLTILIILSFLSIYYISVTGISSYQGDRLVVPAIAVWIPLYVFVTYNLQALVMNRIKKTQ